MSRRVFLSASLASAMLLTGTAGAVLGHECAISSRSAQGNIGAVHSARWTTLTTEYIFASAHLFVGGEALTPEQIAWAVEAAAAAGVPSSFTIRTDKTIGEGSANPNLTDGRGLDHIFDLYGETLLGVFFAARLQ